ncbi:hypothetical protein [Janthinobacterium sp. RB2R34]|uniref:hypothetical protein n=1 Tax=Janthinobacterium sp. RB2R34 TaxID=3424193 RepID=UPI003F2020D6
MNQHITLTPPAQSLLHLSFDADQRGSGLGHTLTRISSTTPDPTPRVGVHADGLYFAPGEQLLLRVTASGAAEKNNADAFDSFQIIDCVIITRPQVIQRGAGLASKYSPPSPFLQAIGSCYPLQLDFRATVNPLTHDNVRIVSQDWKGSLDIGVSPGMWDLSLVLTVRITRGPGAISEVRVFWFDPETEVGSTGTMK